MKWRLSLSVDRSKWPVMVQLGLWGLPSRWAAWGFFDLSVAVAVSCIAYGLVEPLFFVGGLLLFAALWYYLSIRWVDRHGTWSEWSP